MTSVFVLLGKTHYEGDTMLGVYLTAEAAEAAYTQYCLERFAFDGYRVAEVEVGAAAEMQW